MLTDFIRYRGEGWPPELDYGLLEMSARIDFLTLVESRDADWMNDVPASEITREVIEQTVDNELDLLYDNAGEKVVIDPDTRDMIVDELVSRARQLSVGRKENDRGY